MSFVSMCRLPTTHLGLGRRDRPGFYRDTTNQRPRSGSYGHGNHRINWKYEPVWTKRLWMRVIFAYTLVAILGLVFVILGSIYVQDAYFHEGTSLPLLVCILAIVSGLIMLFGSCILGKLFISKKWKQQQQVERFRANRANRAGGSGEDGESDFPSEPPPPYTAYGDPSTYDPAPEPPPPQEVVSSSPMSGSASGVIPPPEYSYELPSYAHQPPSYAESTAEVHMSS